MNAKAMPQVRFAINGAGRIGRAVFRAFFEHRDCFPHCHLVAMNDPHDFKTLAHLLRYDSVHGKAPFPISLQDEKNQLVAGGTSVDLYASRDPLKLPWSELDVDCVLECTGRFKDQSSLRQHLTAGARRVILSAPAKGPVDATIVLGANDALMRAEHQIVSIGSCTTNALAPVLYAVQKLKPIERCFFTTIHAYTKDQSLVDTHHADLRRARAASQSMIPTKTGAAKAIDLVLPELAGKVTGYAIRVPTVNVSLLDMVIQFAEDVSFAKIDAHLRDAVAKTPSLGLTDEPLVSCDFNQNPHSAVLDMSQTQVNGHTVRLVAWYDNEWAYAMRLLDVMNQLAVHPGCLSKQSAMADQC